MRPKVAPSGIFAQSSGRESPEQAEEQPVAPTSRPAMPRAALAAALSSGPGSTAPYVPPPVSGGLAAAQAVANRLTQSIAAAANTNAPQDPADEALDGEADSTSTSRDGAGSGTGSEVVRNGYTFGRKYNRGTYMKVVDKQGLQVES